MNPHLEALLRAYDAYLEAAEDQREQREAIYNSHLDDAAERSKVSRDALHLSIKFQYRDWLKAQKRPPTIPPKA